MDNPLADVFSIVQIIGIIVNVPIIVAFAYFFAKAWEARPHVIPEPPQEPTDTSKRLKVQLAWNEIANKAADGNVDSLRVSIINADKLIDTLLKDAGYTGDGALERMRQIDGNRVSSLQGLLRAHRVRNSIVHDTDFTLTTQLGQQTLQDFAAFLREVGYID